MSGGGIVAGPERSQLDCACSNKVFFIVVEPLANGQASVIELYCAQCQKGAPVVNGVLGAVKPPPETDYYTEKRTGRKHHMMKCDPIYVGAKPGGIGKQ